MKSKKKGIEKKGKKEQNNNVSNLKQNTVSNLNYEHL